MAGFNKQKARELFSIPDDLTIIEIIAVGHPGDPMDLPEAIREQEHPQPRVSVDKFLLRKKAVNK